MCGVIAHTHKILTQHSHSFERMFMPCMLPYLFSTGSWHATVLALAEFRDVHICTADK